MTAEPQRTSGRTPGLRTWRRWPATRFRGAPQEAWAHRTVGSRLTVQDLPATVTASSARWRLLTQDARQGSLLKESVRVPVALTGSGARGGGFVELSYLAAGVTHVDVCLGSPQTPLDAASLAKAVAATGRTMPPLGARAPSRAARRARRAACAGVAGVALLAGAGAVRALAPPEPVDLATALEQHRRHDAPRPTAPSGERRAVAPGAEPRRSSAPAAGLPSAVPHRPEARAAVRAAGPGRAARPRAAAHGAPRPLPGVYVYETRGGEEIDRPSARHDYPSETHVSVRYAGCGVVTRWQPVEDRWDETETCPAAEPALRRTATHRAFFGQQQEQDLVCASGALAWSPTPERSWTNRCAAADVSFTMRARSVGRETRTVDGQAVDTVRVLWRGEMRGRSEGTWVSDRWVDVRTGLLVKAVTQVDVTSSTAVGRVRYQEHVELELVSLRPHR